MTDPPGGPELDPTERRALPYRRAPGARLSRGQGGEEADYYLRAPGGQLFVLGEHERLLWDLLDGAHSFAEIERDFRARFGIGLRHADFMKFVAELADAGALEQVADGEPPVRLVSLDAPSPPRKRVELAGAGGGVAEEVEAGATAEAARSADAGGARRPGGPRWRQGGRKGKGFRTGMKDLWSFTVGNPEKFYDACAAVYWPIRYISWLLIPLVLAAFLIGFKHQYEWELDFSTFVKSIPQWPCLWIAEHLTTWTGKIIEGTVIHGFGGKVRRFDVKLFMGLFVRCHLEDTNVRLMTRRQKLWIASSTLLWRLFCWAICMVIWLEFRPTRPLIAQLALFEAFMGIASFLICSCPLIPLYGYKFLETLLDMDGLYGRSLRLFMLKVKGRQVPDDLMGIGERWGLVFMAVGTTVFFSLYILHILYSADVWTVKNMAGLGAWLAGIHMGACVLYFYLLWRLSARIRVISRADRLRGPPAPDAPLQL